MCLVVVGWKTASGKLLNCAGNRDEFYDRPSLPLHWWDNQILAGRDQVAMGTWMGVNRQGRFAVVTNYRDPNLDLTDKESRGDLVSAFLSGQHGIEEFDQQLLDTAGNYAGYNLLYSTLDEMHYFSNIDRNLRVLGPGTYGISNHLLDTPWPKLIAAKHEISSTDFDKRDSLAILRRQDIPPGQLPDTKIGLDREKQLAPLFVQTEAYGTRASSYLSINSQGGVSFFERSFDRTGAIVGDEDFEFEVNSP